MQKIERNPLIGAAAIIFTAVLAIMAICGCSTLEVADPTEVIRHPLGTESIKLGMTRQQVESLWGKPDDIRMVEKTSENTGSREMWIYRAQYSAIPVDAGYLSKTKKLYFDGDNLTEIGE